MRDALGLADIVTATMANIAPAMSFYFGFGLIAVAAGVASPLTVLSAGVAIAVLGNTLSQFSRLRPSTGSFVTFIGLAFGPISAVTVALVAGAGYIVAMGSVVTAAGSFSSVVLGRLTGIVIPWQLLMLVLTGLAAWLMVLGVQLSTRWAGALLGFEMLVMLGVSALVLIEHAGHLSMIPLTPRALTHGVLGLGLGFPLAAYLFIGWENSAALAEETADPRRNVSRAVYLSIAVMGACYTLFAYVTVVGFQYDVTELTHYDMPFVAVSARVLGGGAFLAYLGGITSTMAALIAGTNSQARMLFSAAREGLLPAWLGRVHEVWRTPVNALLAFVVVTIFMVLLWSGIGGLTPVQTFSQMSSFGALLVLAVYLLANLSLPVFFRRYAPEQYRRGPHLIIPLVGVVAISLPTLQLVRQGQPPPYDAFPWAAAAVGALALLYAIAVVRRRPSTGSLLGSVVDE
jgi:amino acid transporter